MALGWLRECDFHSTLPRLRVNMGPRGALAQRVPFGRGPFRPGERAKSGSNVDISRACYGASL